MTEAPRALIDRLDAVHSRLEELSRHPSAGLTTPDPTTGEQWEASQVWAHIAEFPAYWLAQLRAILTATSADVPRFGRMVGDPARLGAISRGRHEPRAELVARAMHGIAESRAFLQGLEPAALSRHGRHIIRGEMSVAEIVERFVVGHLEEHADQLASLIEGSAPTGK